MIQNTCIEFPRGLRNGYGAGDIWVGGRGYAVYQHRIAYELAYGPIPPGMQVMHECDNRKCVNPDHLRIGTHADNMADMVAKGRAQRWQAALTHCKRGHEFTPENTYIRDGYRRQCKPCVLMHSKNNREKRKIA